MSISRKNYEAVAAIVKDAAFEAAECIESAAGDVVLGEDERLILRRELAVPLARYFASDNPAFDRARFLKACGVAS